MVGCLADHPERYGIIIPEEGSVLEIYEGGKLIEELDIKTRELKIRCHRCGNVWFIIPTKSIINAKCPECGSRKVSITYEYCGRLISILKIKVM